MKAKQQFLIFRTDGDDGIPEFFSGVGKAWASDPWGAYLFSSEKVATQTKSNLKEGRLDYYVCRFNNKTGEISLVVES